MPPRSNDASSALCRTRNDTWYFLRLSSLESMVALMLVFGVAASIGQPIIKSIRNSLASSVRQLSDPPQGAVTAKPKTPTAGRKGANDTARRASVKASQVDRPER